MRILWPLAVAACALAAAVWVAVDVLVHWPASRIRHAARWARDYTYARSWGMPLWTVRPGAQDQVAAALREHAARTLPNDMCANPVPDEEWMAFVIAHGLQREAS